MARPRLQRQQQSSRLQLRLKAGMFIKSIRMGVFPDTVAYCYNGNINGWTFLLYASVRNYSSGSFAAVYGNSA